MADCHCMGVPCLHNVSNLGNKSDVWSRVGLLFLYFELPVSFYFTKVHNLCFEMIDACKKFVVSLSSNCALIIFYNSA